ncbi:MAG: CopG family transcriptional regulator [Phycisphaerae bacterium]|nr:CopG family transcriptional regulator [Phycisphaerae bacterium]
MIMPNHKQSIVTFKAEGSLVEALKTLPNRSEFIRAAILAALDNVCPLCQGTGLLTPEQKAHWAKFAEDHAVRECGDCHEWHIVCCRPPAERVHTRQRKGNRRQRPARHPK